MIPHCLIAYDAAGDVVATLDHMVAHDDMGNVVGLIDFAAHEAAGGEHTDVWAVDGAKGSKVWPEWLGARAHEFRVELAGPPGQKRIAALVHRTSGHRRARDGIEAAIEARISEAQGRPADIRDLVGGPNRPLTLDEAGRVQPRAARPVPKLPLVGRIDE